MIARETGLSGAVVCHRGTAWDRIGGFKSEILAAFCPAHESEVILEHWRGRGLDDRNQPSWA